MNEAPQTPPKRETAEASPLWKSALASLAPFLGILVVGLIFTAFAPENLSPRTWRIMLVQTVPVGSRRQE